jgi:lysozyme
MQLVKVGAMAPSTECRDLVKHWEGIRDGDPDTPLYDPYICPALVVTIGFGHAIKRPDGSMIRAKSKDDKLAIEEGVFFFQKLFQKSALTLAECEALLLTDLTQFAHAVSKMVRADTPQNQFDALTSFAFNAGPLALKKSTLLRLHQKGVPPNGGRLTAVEMKTLVASTKQRLAPTDVRTAFTAWSHAGSPPQFLSGLFRRRISEYLLYTGERAADAIALALKAV